MALRLRRGTDAERLLITPVEGELIYTTDTKLLYVGDGSTAGGTLVTGAGGGGSTTLDALTDTDLTDAENNDVLTYNAGTNKWEAIAVPGVGILSLNNLSDVFLPTTPTRGDILAFDGLNFTRKSITEVFEEQQNYKINIVGDDSTIIIDTDTNNVRGNEITANLGFVGDLIGNVTGNAAGDHTGTFVGTIAASGTLDGDLNGSVFGDDSTLIVDAINNRVETVVVATNTINSRTGIPITLSNQNRTPLQIKSVTDGGLGGFPYTEFLSVKGTVSAPQSLAAGDIIGGWKITGYDSAADVGKVSALWISAFEDDAVVTDNYPKSSATLLISKGGNSYNQFMFGSAGEFKAPGAITPGVFADAAARDAAITTPTAGMIVYITDVAKFQGNTDGTITGWANLN
jgi:hypothetical protein